MENKLLLRQFDCYCIWATLLIHLNCPVDLSHKPETSEEANGSCNEAKRNRHHKHVSKVNHSGNKTSDFKFRRVIPNGVEEKIDSRRTSGQESSPPPAIVFIAKLKVAHYNRDLSSSYDQNDKHNEEKAKYKIELKRITYSKIHTQ